MNTNHTIQAALTAKQQSSPASNALQHQIKQTLSASFSDTLQTELKNSQPLAAPANIKHKSIHSELPNVANPTPSSPSADTEETDDGYSEAKYAVKMGLYNYMIEQREEELRAKAEQQVLEEQGLSKEDVAALTKEEQDHISQLIEERYQTLRKALIEEMIAQLKQQLQNALKNTTEEEQPALPQAMLFMPPA